MTAETDNMATPEPARFRIIFPGLLMILALAGLDQNIVSTALPRIVDSLGGLSQLPWVVTAFLLAQTITTPLHGKLSDMYGRRIMFFISVAIFLAGSMLCGTAQTMGQLIAFRGLQGLGAGGLMTLVQTTLGDFVSPRERTRYSGYFSAVITLCSVAGPLLGGYITEWLTWRWIFFVNLPIGAVAISIIAIGLPRHQQVHDHRVDYLGILLLTVFTTAFLLLLSALGKGDAIDGVETAGLAVLGVIGLVAFLRCEHRAAEPVIPLSLFKNRVFVVSALTIALNFAALAGVGLFLPLFFQYVVGMSPSKAGLMTVPLMVGLIVSSVLSGKIVSAFGRYKFLPVIGLAAVIVADISLSIAVSSPEVRIPLVLALITLIGLGSGLIMPVLNTAIQNAADPGTMGVATATSIFFRSLGAALGTTLAGAVMNWQLHRSLNMAGSGVQALLRPETSAPSSVASGDHLVLLTSYQHGLSWVYVMGACFVAVGFLIVQFLPERPIRQ